MHSQLANWWMMEPQGDAGGELSHRKAIVIGCGAVVIIGAASYTLYKYRHGIGAFVGRLYTSVNQCMPICSHDNKDESESAVPVPSSSQEEVKAERDGEDGAHRDSENGGGGDDDGAIPIRANRVQMEELIANDMFDEMLDDEMAGNLTRARFTLERGEFGEQILIGPFEQVNGTSAAQALRDAGLTVDEMAPEQQEEQRETSQAGANAALQPPSVEGATPEKSNAPKTPKDGEKKDGQPQKGDEDIGNR